MKTIRDAVHGDMTFDAVEMSLIDTPTVQRLRGIKQLGMSHLVFPSAVHTRFEHSLGSCWITRRILAALAQSGDEVPAAEQQVVRLAALLHDVTHVPFGHTFEDERRLFDRHDEDADRLSYFLDQPAMSQALNAAGMKQPVREVLGAGSHQADFRRDIVRGSICADLLDYLKRDAYFTGLSLAYDDRLFQYFHLAENRLVVRLHKQGSFRRDALSELIRLLEIRYFLTERVYYHHAKVVAGAMLSRALELVLDAGVFQREELYRLRDDSLLDRLRSLADQTPGVADVLDDLESRRLYKRVYFLTAEGFGTPGLPAEQRDELAARFHASCNLRRSTERTIADWLGVPESHVILYCPSPAMSLKEADVPVEVEPGKVQPLSALKHPDVEALSEKHRGLWRFYICLRREHVGSFASVQAKCESLIGFPNQLEPQKRGQLAFGER